MDKITFKQIEELIDSILSWWDDHKYDVRTISDGEYAEEYNVYDTNPDFIKKAMEMKKMTEQEVKNAMHEREKPSSIEISAGSAAKGVQFTVKHYYDPTNETETSAILTNFYKVVQDAKSRGFIQ
jgi:hypothetical protein